MKKPTAPLRSITPEQLPDMQKFLDSTAQFREIIMMYECAIKEIRTKLEILNNEFSAKHERNPIEFITSRVKTPKSIVEKLQRYGVEISLESMQEHLNDVAGIRVICSFIDDIYAIAEMLVKQDDIIQIALKDYIKNPKPNGYRSLHLVLETPVYFSDGKRIMKVEVQIRTIAMDFWASLEHQLKYKKDIPQSECIIKELTECAQTINQVDMKMQEIRDKIYIPGSCAEQQIKKQT